jgi:Ribbon-helix-helix protein, copG family
MRTTVDLDDDVAAAIKRLRAERGLGLSEAVNELARAGLSRRARSARFRQRTAPIGLRLDVSNVAEAIETLDGPASR